jgi:ribosomal 50S subunit-recycling heat shock protein
VRLDLFLKKVGLVRQRTRAKEICDRGRVTVNGSSAKPSRDVHPGAEIVLDIRDSTLEIEVLSLPDRNYKRRAGEVFYKTIRHDHTEPFF